MSNLNKEKFERYAEIKRQIKALESEADELSPELMRDMEAEGVDKVDAEVGTFTVSGKKKWTYSDALQNEEAALKEQKKDEQATGVATYEESKFLVFRDPVPAGHVVAAGAVAQEV